MMERNVLSQLKKVGLGLLVFSTVLLGAPGAAHAQLSAPVPGLVVPVGDAVNTYFNATLTEKEIVADVFGWLQKALIQQMTKQMVNWINSGFDGNPAFITNPFERLVDLAYKEAESFIGGAELGGLNDAFETQVRSSLASYFTDNFAKKITSDLPTSIDSPEEYNRFVGGDFSQGGWEGFIAVTQDEANNSFGAFLKGESELSQRIATKQAIETTIWDWGDGFDSLRDGLGNIQTPGALIQGRLNEQLGSGLRQLELADEFNEIVGALVAQLDTQLFTGAKGLLGLSESSDGSGSSYLERLANEQVDVPGTDQINPNIPTGSTGSGFFNGNIARSNNVETSQSGTLVPFRSDNAIDGQTDSFGRTDDKASSVTGSRAYPWWQIDLKGNYAIDIVRVIPRPEVSANAAVGTYRLFVSDVDFLSFPNFDPTNPPSGVWASSNQQPGGDINNIFVNRRGRFVRVQRVDTGPTGSARLQLAEVEVIENEGPKIDLNGSANITIDKGDNYSEPGATITDTLDPNPDLDISGTVKEDQVGSYTITYTATDSGGAVTVVTRTVNVVEN